MADILFLAHRVPYPPDRGDKIRSYNILKHLAASHRVHLGTFADDAADIDAAQHLSDMLGQVHVEPRTRSNAASLLRGLMTRAPASVAAYASKGMDAFVDKVLSEEAIDRVYVFSGQMAQFAPEDRPFLMDFVDVDSAKFESYADGASGGMRRVWKREGRRLAVFEREIARRAAVSLFVSEAEAALFRERAKLAPERVQVLENGIDLDHYVPQARPAGEPPLLVFTGQMDYRPNVEAVTGFAREAFPIVRRRHPDARFAIVGRNPDPSLAGLGDGIEVVGGVPDMRPWLTRASVVVAPLRIARGVQNKVLEAMAMARPVVASPQAFEGIVADPGSDLIVADGWAAEAEAVAALLADPARAEAIGASARARIVARYGWEARLAPLDAMMAHI